MSKRGLAMVIARLNKVKDEVKVIRERNAQLEADTLRFTEQQAKELAGIQFPEWVNVDVRVMGESAGRYRMSFEAGSPMERLTAEQVRRLMAVLSELEGI